MEGRSQESGKRELEPLLVLKGKVQHQHPSSKMWMHRRLKLQDGVLIYFDDIGKTVLMKLRFWEVIVRALPDEKEANIFYILWDDVGREKAEMTIRVDSQRSRDTWIQQIEAHYQRCALLMARLHVHDTPAEANAWMYCDRHGMIQGPFTLEQMLTWHEHGHFPHDLMVWTGTNQEAARPLGTGNMLRDTAIRIRAAVKK